MANQTPATSGSLQNILIRYERLSAGNDNLFDLFPL